MQVTVTHYAEFRRWIESFLRADGLGLLFVIGQPGVCKSRIITAGLDDDRHRRIKAGRLTAFQLYKHLYQVRDKAIILDDVDDALSRRDIARILMALCETDVQARTIAWLGSESQMKIGRGRHKLVVPQEFETSSRVCIVSNDLDVAASRLSPLLDRGTAVFFEPTVQEIHRFVGEWFKDREVYEYIEARLGEIPQHSARYYVNAAEHKRLGHDWRAALEESWTRLPPKGDEGGRLVERLLADRSFKNDKERIEAFAAHVRGGSRRTWFYAKKRLAR